MNTLPNLKDFDFKEGNTYKMSFESSFLDNSIVALTAQKDKDQDIVGYASVSIFENVITAIIPNHLKRGTYNYDLEVNRNGIITTEFRGRIFIS
ncbi:hypothetical protein [Leptospira bouyouniensis]|uniref:Uncharacterized protein n=1 Tax=Leptospira bouyouniensis TaxID=2484911 RepID=A0ABY2L2Z7_9LEPT|nr:hypothetical protein [Leptospira bouyouniensis]TGK45520.1 hypothetical protein EHQ10_18915 [Leptospira bouyouniensis]